MQCYSEGLPRSHSIKGVRAAVVKSNHRYHFGRTLSPTIGKIFVQSDIDSGVASGFDARGDH
jgi:hypothetical protein